MVVNVLHNRIRSMNTMSTVVRIKKINCRIEVPSTSLTSVRTNRRVGICASLGISRSTVALFNFNALTSGHVFLRLRGIDNVKPGITLSLLSALPPSQLTETITSNSTATLTGTPKLNGGNTRGVVLRLGNSVSLDRVRNSSTATSAPRSAKTRRIIRNLVSLK